MSILLKKAISMSQIYKSIIIGGILTYATIATIILIRLDPKPILIAIDSNSTRIIQTEDDKLLNREKINFIREFIHENYNFDESNYLDRVNRSGEYMSKKLWESKVQEYRQIYDRLKNDSLSQSAKIVELREIDKDSFELDLELRIQNKLKLYSQKIRVFLILKSKNRTTSNPYNVEIEELHETIL